MWPPMRMRRRKPPSSASLIALDREPVRRGILASMTQLVFDERVAAQLEAFYGRRQVQHRRALVLEALAPQRGDAILDVGCGPGFYVADLLDHGATVTGVDSSPAMLAIARQRAPGACLLEGTATRLPVADATFDRALSVQVFEYVAAVDGGLAELRRVLRPGGRLLIWDIDWSTVSWHSRDAERMGRVLAAWDRHLADPVLPRTLAAALRRAGFADVERHAHVFDTTAMDPETFGGNLPTIIRRYLNGLEDVDQDDATAWVAELRERDARGEYSFAFTQFCFTATR
jgi:arsenite methyltransferase